MGISMKTGILGMGLVDFDKMECCALAHAFARNPDLVKKTLELKAIPAKKLKIFGNIMINSLSLSFRPNEEMKLAYNLFARAEERRLNSDAKSKLVCPHSEQSHLLALQSVLSKLSAAIN